MSEKEKEKKIIGMIYNILADKRNQNRYSSTMFGNMEKNEIVRLSDCMEYLENKYKELTSI